MEKTQKDKPPTNAIEVKKNEFLAQPIQSPQLPQVKQIVEPDSEGCSVLTAYETCSAAKPKCRWLGKDKICIPSNQNPQPQYQQQQYQQPQNPQPPQPQFKAEILPEDMFDLSKL